jgi:hypothetical protein
MDEELHTVLFTRDEVLRRVHDECQLNIGFSLCPPSKWGLGAEEGVARAMNGV